VIPGDAQAESGLIEHVDRVVVGHVQKTKKPGPGDVVSGTGLREPLSAAESLRRLRSYGRSDRSKMCVNSTIFLS
jgi:hypothetical protein